MVIAFLLAIFLIISTACLAWTAFHLEQKYREIGEKNAFLDELLKNAGITMYKAQRIEGDVFYYFKKDSPLETEKNKQIVPALWNAINNNELVLHYQPKLTLSDNKIVGVEALLRWNNPTLGLIDPVEFIPLTEETGLISHIGEWALREACRVNKAWQNQGYGHISVAVNISPKQFAQQSMPELISKILIETGLQPEYLELEITENAIMENIELATKKLTQIQRMGVRVAVDDFGTGYTSIKYLKHFPLHAIKIDQSFIKELPLNKNDAAITSAVIALAHKLGLTVIAEGVETSEQMAFLLEHNCDVIQGYYFAKPESEEELRQRLKRG